MEVIFTVHLSEYETYTLYIENLFKLFQTIIQIISLTKIHNDKKLLSLKLAISKHFTRIQNGKQSLPI